MNEQEFQRATAPHRRALQAHCYRMMGSWTDAEDVLQETLIRAWRGISGFEGRSSLQSWLYRIATNACLDALESRPARTLPTLRAPALADGEAPGPPLSESIWVEPYPDDQLPGPGEETLGPEVQITTRESVALAFLAVLQLLPPRQRAVLILRDVLGWQADEVAALLETSVASVNSALQRARATLEEHQSPPARRVPDAEVKSLLGRYLKAWEQSDLRALVALLKEDATLSMPPLEAWLRGPEAIVAFLTAVALRPGVADPFRCVATAANGTTAVAFYERQPDGTYRPQSLQVMTFDGDRIATLTSFLDPRLPLRFGLPATL